MSFFNSKKEQEYFEQQAKEKFESIQKLNEKTQEIENNQKEWGRRLNEGGWLLEGANRINDATLSAMGTYSSLETHEKYAMQLSDLKKDYDRNMQSNKKIHDQQPTSMFSYKALKNKVVDYINHMNKNNSRIKERARNAKLVLKEQVAEQVILNEAKRERKNFIKQNALHIRVLQNVRLLLNRPRLPQHHQPVQRTTDENDMDSVEYAEAISKANLRSLPIPDRELVSRDRYIDEGVIRSVKEIQKEIVENQKYKISSRFHHFLGSHRLYPLKLFPNTHVALYSADVYKTSYPEDQLLPDYEEIKRKELKKKLKKKQMLVPIKKFKKSFIDMSRRQVRYLQSSSASEVAVQPITTTNTSRMIGNNQDRNSNSDHLIDEYDNNNYSNTNNNNNNNIVNSSNHRVNEEKEVRYSTQFKWKQREYVDANSVYNKPHGPIIFDTDHLSDVTSTIADSIDVQSSVKYHLLPKYNEDIRYTYDLDSDSMMNQLEPELHNGVSYMASVINTDSLSSTNHYQPSDIISNNNNNTYQDNSNMNQNRIDIQSIDAVRSNYLSINSSKPDEKYIKLHFQRFRKVHKLSMFHIKDKNFHLESKKSQNHRKEKQEYFKKHHLY